MVSSLVVTGAQYTYPSGVRAVGGVDLQVGSGELLALIGPNGSGKSTLLKLCAGLLRPLEGDVRYENQRVWEFDAQTRARHIALVPQSLRALPDVTVHDFVLGGRYGHLGFWKQESAHDLEMARLALAAADIEPLAERLLTELSGGQRQRVLISRALAQEAMLLLVDEPTNSLDPEHQVQVFDMLAGLARNGRAVLVVTHDLNLASQFATRLAVLRQGEVVASGSPSEVLRPEILEPVYGPHLHYGTLGEHPPRPFVLPWKQGPQGAS